MTSNESAEIFSSKRIGFGAASLALVTSFLWGGNQVFIKIGLQGMPPQAMAALRFSIGLIVVVVAAFVAKESVRVYPGEWRHLFGLAILFLTQISLLNQGVFYTTASRASVTIAAHPFFLALFCHFFVTLGLQGVHFVWLSLRHFSCHFILSLFVAPKTPVLSLFFVRKC